MRKTLALLTLVLTMLALSVPVAMADHGTLTPQGNCPEEGKVEGADVDQDLVLPAGTHVCIKGGSGDAVLVTADGTSTLFELLGNGSGVSHYTIIEEATTTTSSTTTTSTTTTTTSTTTTTTLPDITTTTTLPTTTTTLPDTGLFSFSVVASVCPDGETALINITFPNRPDLNGQVGTLSFAPVGEPLELTFISGATVQVFYPATTGDVTLTYVLGDETATATVSFPENCAPGTTTTTIPSGTTTTTLPGPTPTPFAFGAAATVCVAEVPTIRIEFQNTFPELAGQSGTLNMADIEGTVVSTQSLVYEPNTTVDLLYPGTSVNADGSIDDVPGWILTDDGLWVRDPSDDFLREGINLTYTVGDETATAFVTYPPESSECANPPPVLTIPPSVPSTSVFGSVPRTPSPGDGELPFTGLDLSQWLKLAGGLVTLGIIGLVTMRKEET